MSTPEELRKRFIDKAEWFLDDYLAAAAGTTEMKGSGIARAAIWDLLSDIIRQAGDKSVLDINGTDMAAKIEDVLTKVSEGTITPQQGKEYMALIQSGFDMSELPKLLAALEQVEA